MTGWWRKTSVGCVLVVLLSIPVVVLGSPQDRIGNDPPVKLDLVFHPGSEESHTISTAVDGDRVHNDTGQGRTAIPLTIVFNPGKKEATTQVILQDTGRDPDGAGVHDAPAKDQGWKAFWEEPASQGREVTWGKTKIQFSLFTGYRRDDLSFNFGGINHNPNILSELIWEDLSSFELTGNLRWTTPSNIYFRANASAGVIFKGNNQDSDYLGNNRTQEFSRSYADSDGGSLFDADVAAGYRFDLPVFGQGGMIRFIPLAGWSYHSQEVEMTDGVLVISEPNPYGGVHPLGLFSGELQSTYDTMWNGPFAGVDLDLKFNEKHSIFASFEYHWINFEAEANWNLRSDFMHPVSFTHDADGQGIILAASYNYRPSYQWTYSIGARYRNMSTDPGNITFYKSDGTINDLQPLNEVNWDSVSINFGLTYHF